MSAPDRATVPAGSPLKEPRPDSILGLGGSRSPAAGETGLVPGQDGREAPQREVVP